MKDARGKRFAISRFGSLSVFLRARACCGWHRSERSDHFADRQHAGALRRAQFRPASMPRLSGFPVTESAKSMGSAAFDLKEMYPEWPTKPLPRANLGSPKRKTKLRVFCAPIKKAPAHPRQSRRGDQGVRKFVKMDPVHAPAGYDQYRDSFPLEARSPNKASPQSPTKSSSRESEAPSHGR